jgi:hypothetical protein
MFLHTLNTPMSNAEKLLSSSTKSVPKATSLSVPPTAEPRKSLDDKMFELFQTLETVKVRLPESEPQRQAYVLALRDLKAAAAGVSGSMTGKELIEAASAFKKARTDYEARLEQLEPSFLTAVLTNIL